MPATPSAPETLVSYWIESFNLRDLDGMLGCVSAEVRFYPLQLDGLDRYYRGRDGMRTWFALMGELNHQHRIDLHDIRAEPGGEVDATGELHSADGAGPRRFWARDQVEGGEIVVVHHYLTDPDILDTIGPLQRLGARPFRFPGP